MLKTKFYWIMLTLLFSSGGIHNWRQMPRVALLMGLCKVLKKWPYPSSLCDYAHYRGSYFPVSSTLFIKLFITFNFSHFCYQASFYWSIGNVDSIVLVDTVQINGTLFLSTLAWLLIIKVIFLLAKGWHIYQSYPISHILHQPLESLGCDLYD